MLSCSVHVARTSNAKVDHVLFFFLFFCFQHHLGDVVYVELPEVGSSVSQGKNFGAVESVKATSDIYSPVSGEVVAVNDGLGDEPGLVSFNCVIDHCE